MVRHTKTVYRNDALRLKPFSVEGVFNSAVRVPVSFSYFSLIDSTYRDAEVVKSIAVIKFVRVFVLVRRKKFTKKFVVAIWRSLYIKRKTWRSFQTGKRALKHVINKIFTKASDIQVGEFVLLEVCITQCITRSTSAYSILWHFYLYKTSIRFTVNWHKPQKKGGKKIEPLCPSGKKICFQLNLDMKNTLKNSNFKAKNLTYQRQLRLRRP